MTAIVHAKRLAIVMLLATVVVGVIVAGCGSAPEQSPGELAFRANCRTCHVLPKPEKYTDEQWPTLVARYGGRAKLSADQIAVITAYLQKANGE